MKQNEFENSLGYNIGKAGHLTINAFHRRLQPLGLDLTLQQLGMLHYISSCGDSNQQELAEIAEKDKSAVLRSIDILERKGYVNRIADPNDRRKNIIKITPKADDILQQVEPHFLAHMEAMTANIPQELLDECVLTLKKIHENARQYLEQSK